MHLLKILEPAAPAIVAAAKNDNHKDDNSQKCPPIQEAFIS